MWHGGSYVYTPLPCRRLALTGLVKKAGPRLRDPAGSGHRGEVTQPRARLFYHPGTATAYIYSSLQLSSVGVGSG